VYFTILIIHNNINLHHLFVHILVFNKHLLINMHGMNIKTGNFNFCYTRTGLTNLWRACSKWHEKSLSWHAALNALPFCLLLYLIRVSMLWRICIYKHTADCVETVYELPLLPNNTARPTYTQIRSGAKCWLDIFHGAPAWRWLGEYVTLDRTFYNLLLK